MKLPAILKEFGSFNVIRVTKGSLKDCLGRMLYESIMGGWLCEIITDDGFKTVTLADGEYELVPM